MRASEPNDLVVLVISLVSRVLVAMSSHKLLRLGLYDSDRASRVAKRVDQA